MVTRRALIPAALVAALMGPRGVAGQADEPESARVLRRFLGEVIIPRNLAAFPELVSPAYQAQDPADIDGPEAWAQRLTDVWADRDAEYWTQTVDEVFGTGELAAARMSWEYAIGSTLFGKGEELIVCRVVSGKIVRWWGARADHDTE